MLGWRLADRSQSPGPPHLAGRWRWGPYPWAPISLPSKMGITWEGPHHWTSPQKRGAHVSLTTTEWCGYHIQGPIPPPHVDMAPLTVPSPTSRVHFQITAHLLVEENKLIILRACYWSFSWCLRIFHLDLFLLFTLVGILTLLSITLHVNWLKLKKVGKTTRPLSYDLNPLRLYTGSNK